MIGGAMARHERSGDNLQPPGNAERQRVKLAINSLSQRCRSPRLKDSLSIEGAISIVLEGLPWATAYAGLSLALCGADHRATKRRPAVRAQADKTFRHLKHLLVLLKNAAARQITADPFNDPEALVVPIMSILGISSDDARRSAFCIAASGTLLRQLAEPVPTIQHQNTGKMGEADFIRELALIWTEITGAPPGKTKCQQGTPFHLFCCQIIGADEVQDISRQINRALKNLDSSEIKMAKNEGYRACRNHVR
jgi:hypothetical protein